MNNKGLSLRHMRNFARPAEGKMTSPTPKKRGRKPLPVDRKRVQLGMKVLPSTKAMFDRLGRKAREIAEAAIIAALEKLA